MSQSERLDPNATLACLPYEVGHSDEGVCLIVQLGPHRIMLDCGLTDIKPIVDQATPPAELVFCSHAHIDHCQGLVALHQAFPEIPIYASEVTAKLLPLNWRQSTYPNSLVKPIAWRSPYQVTEDLSFEIYQAGHLPGAAAVAIHYRTPERTYCLFYSGDFCLSNLQLVEGLSIETLKGISPDVLIIEGSYGTMRHPHRRQQEKQLMERVVEAINRGYRVLLPVTPLGLGQEILKLLRSHHQFTGRDLDIWVDQAVAAGCDAYLDILPQLPAAVQNFARHQPLFWDERVCPRMRRIDSKQIAQTESPYIVVADYRSDLTKYFSAKSQPWIVLFPEHPRLSFTPYVEPLFALKDLLPIEIETYLLAQHSDGRNTTQLIHNLRPQHVVLVHGSSNYLSDLACLEDLSSRYQVHSPAAGITVSLPIGDKFIQPAAPVSVHYEGEITENNASVTITLPETINQDPRFTKLADTGLLQARWQGDELVLRGLSQRELLEQSQQTKILADVECCSNCRHYRSQRCWQKSSPLYGFRVTPEGYCQAFEKLNSDKE